MNSSYPLSQYELQYKLQYKLHNAFDSSCYKSFLHLNLDQIKNEDSLDEPLKSPFKFRTNEKYNNSQIFILNKEKFKKFLQNKNYSFGEKYITYTHAFFTKKDAKIVLNNCKLEEISDDNKNAEHDRIDGSTIEGSLNKSNTSHDNDKNDNNLYNSDTEYNSYNSDSEYNSYNSDSEYNSYNSDSEYNSYNSDSEYNSYNSDSKKSEEKSDSDYYLNNLFEEDFKDKVKKEDSEEKSTSEYYLNNLFEEDFKDNDEKEDNKDKDD
ncbi:hypothetical protein EHP00_2264 [Ecytonucleospora hepatopenaei]|uniref:Uncharacterized protein n=1 Tax=Ecytonucleospora hepatopenaei TaxID=646526 RepID=A0A1W0E413_9MICR|nr:hypothetical protein EHP00_2264 [Ecytonucleospora hepatopenaei]